MIIAAWNISPQCRDLPNRLVSLRNHSQRISNFFRIVALQWKMLSYHSHEHCRSFAEQVEGAVSRGIRQCWSNWNLLSKSEIPISLLNSREEFWRKYFNVDCLSRCRSICFLSMCFLWSGTRSRKVWLISHSADLLFPINVDVLLLFHFSGLFLPEVNNAHGGSSRSTGVNVSTTTFFCSLFDAKHRRAMFCRSVRLSGFDLTDVVRWIVSYFL